MNTDKAQMNTDEFMAHRRRAETLICVYLCLICVHLWSRFFFVTFVPLW